MLNIEEYNIFRKQNKTLTVEDIKMMSPLALAYIGDAVFEMLIRTKILHPHKNAHKLHLESSKLVNAKAQSKFLKNLEEALSEEEIRVIKRARNSKLNTMPKNQSVHDYKDSTGLEALFGYHYLLGNEDRIIEIYELGSKNES